jgi:hypothetical protein
VKREPKRLNNQGERKKTFTFRERYLEEVKQPRIFVLSFSSSARRDMVTTDIFVLFDDSDKEMRGKKGKRRERER